MYYLSYIQKKNFSKKKIWNFFESLKSSRAINFWDIDVRFGSKYSLVTSLHFVLTTLFLFALTFLVMNFKCPEMAKKWHLHVDQTSV